MSKLPSSQLARASVVGSTAVKLGVGKLKIKAKRPFLSEQGKQKAKESQYDEDADILFKAITKLRGTAVKMAQMLGMETDLLPERVREELSKSYHQVPPLNRVLVEKAINKEFGKGSNQVFEMFNPVAMAAASLGQVHRAQVDDGTDVAVKLQYPGIHISIESDLKLLRKLAASGIRMLPKQRQPNKEVVETSIDEIGSRLMEETDYLLEAQNTRWFKENLSVDGVQTPKVYDRYCTDRVITTELLDGLHIDDWLATGPSQKVRDEAAQRIYELFIHSTVAFGRVHADPNPGNYLFKENGELALIDFGCVKQLSRHFTEHFPTLLYAFYLDDIDKIISAYSNLGMRVAPKLAVECEKVLRPFGEWLSRPIKEPYFDFKKNNDYTSSGLSLLKDLSEMPFLESVEEDFIFFDRTLYGLFKIFERLEAKVYMRKHWEKIWGVSLQ